MTTKKSSNIASLKATNIYESINATTYKKHKPRAYDLYIRDTDLKGFYLRIRPSGHKTYVCSARLGGGKGPQRYPVIGSCELITQDEARKTAKEWLVLLSKGINPKEEIKKESAKKKTLAKACKEYLDFIGNEIADYTQKDYLRKMRIQMSSLSSKRVNDIGIDEVKTWWRKSSKSRGDVLAYQYASKVFDYLVTDEYLEINPFRKVKAVIKFPAINEKETHIPQDQLYNYLGSMWKVYPKLGKTMRDLVFFILLTGKRLKESASLEWDNVDFNKGAIYLPITKTKKADVVPMTPFLMLMLAKRRKHKPNTKYVFHNRNKQKDGHVTDPRKALAAISKEANLGFGITAHDLRRTFATASKELGFSNEDTAILLNHVKKNQTEKYISRSIEYNRNRTLEVQHYINNNSNSGIAKICVDYYDGNEEIFNTMPDEYFEPLSYEEQNKHWFNK